MHTQYQNQFCHYTECAETGIKAILKDMGVTQTLSVKSVTTTPTHPVLVVRIAFYFEMHNTPLKKHYKINVYFPQYTSTVASYA